MLADTYEKRIYSVNARKKLGLPNGLGDIQLGVSLLGDDNPLSGIYKTIRSSKGIQTYKFKYYRPTNPKTTTQQAWRAYFTLCVNAWGALTDEQKKYWRDLKRPEHMSGWNRFLSYHLKAHDL